MSDKHLAVVLAQVATEIDRARETHGLRHDVPMLGDAYQAQTWTVMGHMVEAHARDALDIDPSWAAILAEAVGEALQAGTVEDLRAGLIQVAAMAVEFVDRIDRGEE